MSYMFGWWLFIAFVWSIYCWARYTDRNAAPIERRIHAAMLGLAWPYTLARFAHDRYADRQAPGRGGTSSALHPGPSRGRHVLDLPATSYDYKPPTGATQHGWKCTDAAVCGRSEHEFVRGWPHRCPDCGSPTDPLLDEPWSHEADGVELQHILRTNQEAYGGFHGDRWPVWLLEDACRRGDGPAIAAARQACQERADRRQVETWWGPGSVYFHVIWTELKFNRLDDAAADLLTWLGRSSSENADTNNTNRTNCRQVIDMSARFLQAPGGASHPTAAEIQRRCVVLATECYKELNTEQQAQVTAMAQS